MEGNTGMKTRISAKRNPSTSKAHDTPIKIPSSSIPRSLIGMPSSMSLTLCFLTLGSLYRVSIAAPAATMTVQPIETLFPVAGSHPLPAPVSSADMAKIEDQDLDPNVSVFSLNSSFPIIEQSPSTAFKRQTLNGTVFDSTAVNQLEVLFCITAFRVGGAGREGFVVSYYDHVVDQRQSVAFTASGPELYLVYKLLQSHTNKDGFWEDLNIFGSTKGLNVGYHPTGKTLNVAGWTPQVIYDRNHEFGKLKVVCQNTFNIKADGPTGSFYQAYIGDYVPSLLSP